MTDFGTDFRSSGDFSGLRDRADSARAAAQRAAERYMQLRRQLELTRRESTEILAQAAQLRDGLRDSVRVYAAILRRTEIPPERAIILVKSAVRESDGYPDNRHHEMVEEAVRWAVDAYYAA